jgi:hypothetical protein
VTDTAVCREFEEDLSALLDDELAPERAGELRAHVAGCERCGARFAALARVDAALAGAPAPAVPAALRARLEARLAAARAADTGTRRLLGWRAQRRSSPWLAGGAAAVAAACAALYLMLVERAPRAPGEAAPIEIARPFSEPPPPAQAPETPREPLRAGVPAPEQIAQHETPASAPPAPAPAATSKPPAAQAIDLDALSEEELGLALELDTVEDLDVIANLEVLERLLAAEPG